MTCPRCTELEALLAKYRELVAKKDEALKESKKFVGHFEGDPCCMLLETGLKEDCNCGATNCHEKIEDAISLPLPESVEGEQICAECGHTKEQHKTPGLGHCGVMVMQDELSDVYCDCQQFRPKGDK